MRRRREAMLEESEDGEKRRRQQRLGVGFCRQNVIHLSMVFCLSKTDKKRVCLSGSVDDIIYLEIL